MLTANVFANVAQSQTDSVLQAAVAGRRFRVVAAVIVPGGTATSVTFNTKGSGAGVAISAAFVVAADTPLVLPHNPDGWFDTTVGQALSCTTGAGSTVGIQLTLKEVYSS